MPEPGFLADFHFLRPAWLLGLVPALALAWFARWRDDATRPWRRLVDAHLLESLRVRPKGRGRLRPGDMVALVLVLSCVGAAGPAWQREPSPFTEDRAPLVIALDLTESMLAIDVPPTRLDRAREKIRDLLARRAGARTGLVVYAGTAHLVMPPTDDAQALESYLAALDPSVMPEPGEDAAAALRVAQDVLDGDGTPGSILFLTDGIPVEQHPAFREHLSSGRAGLLVIAVGTSEGGPIRSGAGFATDAAGRRVVARLDRDGLEALARDSGAFVASATLGAEDVDRVAARIQTRLEEVRDVDATARWRDAGWGLSLPVALFAALWFRRGWTVRWAATLIMLVASAGAQAQTAQTAPPPDWSFADLWLTRDQQGRLAFDRGDYPAAAVRFQDPMWRGVACARAGDWDCAVDSFARLDTAEAFFNLGHAYARRGELALAVEAYDQALGARPDWPEARHDRDLVAALLPKPEDDEEAAAGDPSLEADEVQFDEKGKKGKAGEIDPSLLTEEQMGEVWLRGLTTSPAGFLRRKFRLQAGERGSGGASAPPAADARGRR